MNKTKKDEAAKKYMIECLTRDVILMLISDCGMDLEKAMDCFYNSKTFEKLENSETGLYYQGPVYVFDILDRELSKDTQKT